MSPDIRFAMLNRLVEEAQTDGFKMWMLSANPLRSLIFPNSYTAKRCDYVYYMTDSKDGACGKLIDLKSLKRNDVKSFLSYASQMAPSVEPALITPV